MGETKIQKNIFTVLMCFGMVVCMTTYNAILQNGFTNIINHILEEIWIVFIIAFILDFFIVGPFVKKKVFSRVKPETKKITIILSISLSMVTSMVLLMSIFGAIMSEGFTTNAIIIYPKVVLSNFIAALPINLIIVSPIARGIFSAIFNDK